MSWVNLIGLCVIMVIRLNGCCVCGLICGCCWCFVIGILMMICCVCSV